MPIHDKRRLLFVCVENAGRSQMAEAFARHYGGDSVEAWSAGARSADEIYPDVIEAMHEKGIDLSRQRPKDFDALPQGAWDWIVTMGCGAECPLTHAVHREDWELPDPRGRGIQTIRHLRDRIEALVLELLKR